MALHDSDSSGEEYATTNVMLGYVSERPTDDIFSHLGGTPTWLDDEAPSASLAACKRCNSVMALILQLNGDLPEYLPNHERKLYVFTCRKKPCRRKPGAIRAIRATKISASAAKPFSHQNPTPMQNESFKSSPPTPNLGDSIFNTKPTGQANTNTNPFSTSFKSTTNANPFSSTKADNPTPYGRRVHSIDPLPTPTTHQDSPLHESFAEKARISSPPFPSSCPRPRSPWPSPSLHPKSYPSYHLDADYETLDAPSPQSAPSSSTHNISSTSSDSKDPPATDEDDDPANWLSGPAKADKIFLRFAARLAQNPEQVLRYEWRGQPLLYSKDDEVGKAFPSASASSTSSHRVPQNRIPNCTNCGARRVFEFQLTPHAISELERDEEGLEGMEWGTIVVASCEKDCLERGVEDGKVGWVEEWAGVSWEESVKGGK
ncbi:MAG: hypothetical protein L6R42_000368 [Xanthoria sp. 1 TBL-2021]|nr:MAG: hypothetical protein L6R42_000368 [Xanthoria sp. 1 TBL-2021]